MYIHRISRLSFLGEELLVSVRGATDFVGENVLTTSRQSRHGFTLVAIEPEFADLLKSTRFERDLRPEMLIAGDIVRRQPKYAARDIARILRGVSLAHVVELMSRQPDGRASRPLHRSMWGTSFVIRERPEFAGIVRWWNPQRVEYTFAFGETQHGPTSGYVLSAVPVGNLGQWLGQGMRVLFPY
jgi:hypothetical protein